MAIRPIHTKTRLFSLLGRRRIYQGILRNLALSSGLILVSFFLRLLLTPVLGTQSPFVLFFPALAIIAYNCPVIYSLLSVLASFMLVDYFILEPVHTFTIKNYYFLFGLVVSSSSMIIMGEMLKKEVIRRRKSELMTRRANELLRIRENELLEANKDLEQFAYMAAHDLKAPLHVISGFAGLLQKRNKDNESIQNHTQSIINQVEGMTLLIRELLDFARVKNYEGKFEGVDCERLLDKVISGYAVEIGEHDIHVTRDPLPTITADRILLTQLFQNLIGNCIKFQSKERLLHIHISSKEVNGEYVFSITDNGIGIHQKNINQIFEIFHRGETTVPGAGIGLAICKRIAELHHGKIWVESELGKRTTFHVAIPAIRKPQQAILPAALEKPLV